MDSRLLVTATGPDRPGIVQRLTQVLVSHGANLEESRMARLGGEFAAIMLVSVREEHAAELEARLKELGDDELHVLTKATRKQPEAFRGYVPYEVVLTGADTRGIVHTVADFLAGQGINIESLETDVTNAPETGIALFSMAAEVQTPPSVSLSDLRKKLGEIADRLGVDIEINPR
jgi:glycine cleavage system transcriptional repressor